MSRRISRILAFQALYSWEVAGVDVDDLISFSWLERDVFDASEVGEDSSEEVKYCLQEKQMNQFEKLEPVKKQEVFDYARILVKGTVENINQIDEIIKKHLSSKWKIERINKVALAVIRMSVYSLLYQKDIDPKITIDEAVEIVKDYGEDETHKFTNAILDHIRKELAETNA